MWPQPELFDLEALAELAGNDQAFVHEMLQLFLDQTPSALNSLEETIANTDHAEIKRLAHKMKSSFNSIGCSHGGQLLSELERMAEKGEDTALMVPRLAELRILSTDLFQALELHMAVK